VQSGVVEIQFSNLQPECYYRGFRDDSGTFTPVHWKILALKFAFVIIFEHVVFGVCRLIDVIVPDIPESLDIKVSISWIVYIQPL
jgi:anoctamin-7